MKANVSFTLKWYQLCILPSGLEQATPFMFYLWETCSEKWQEENQKGKEWHKRNILHLLPPAKNQISELISQF